MTEEKEDSKTEKLKPFLYEILQLIHNYNLKDSELELDRLSLQLFVNLTFSGSEETKIEYLLEKGIDCKKIVNELNNILLEDEHLMKCCGNHERFALLLDRFILEVFRLTQAEIPNEEMFNEYFNNFSEILYSEPFRAVVFSHLFNFTSEKNILDFGEFKVLELEVNERLKILGDYSTVTSYHPNELIGKYFIVSTELEFIPNDWEWLISQRFRAEDFARLFQYFKDDLIHINYSAVRYYPEWVNSIRNGGVFYYGEHRKVPHEMGDRMYSISETEYIELIDWLSLYRLPNVENKFDKPRIEKNDLGQKIELAGIYFEASHTHNDIVRRLIDLSIALEIIFHPHNKDEIAFQLSQLAAQTLGINLAEKQEIFKDVKLFYTKRSNVVHGNLRDQERKPITIEEIERWSGLIRKSMLKLITLYIRGYEKHEEIIKFIRDGLFDSELSNKFQNESDLSILIKELKN